MTAVLRVCTQTNMFFMSPVDVLLHTPAVKEKCNSCPLVARFSLLVSIFEQCNIAHTYTHTYTHTHTHTRTHKHTHTQTHTHTQCARKYPPNATRRPSVLMMVCAVRLGTCNRRSRKKHPSPHFLVSGIFAHDHTPQAHTHTHPYIHTTETHTRTYTTTHTHTSRPKVY